MDLRAYLHLLSSLLDGPDLAGKENALRSGGSTKGSRSSCSVPVDGSRCLWSPFVYGWGDRGDSHLVALPKNLDQDSVRRLLLVVRNSLSGLSSSAPAEATRHVYFDDATWLLVGIGCSPRTLSERGRQQVQGSGRSVPAVFVGWLTPARPTDVPSGEWRKPLVPSLETWARHLKELFVPGYQFLLDRWDYPDAEPVRQPAQALSRLAELTAGESEQEPSKPHLPRKKICPDTKNADLWNRARHHPGPVSLCLNLHEMDEELCPFQVVTLRSRSGD